MDSARWERAQALFHQALNLPEDERQAFLLRECADDQELHDEVKAMLEGHARSNSLLDGDKPNVAQQALGAFLESIPYEEFRPYRITGELDRGGMGVVYRAEREDGNPVAIKVLRDWWVSPERKRRFAIEQKSLGKLDHPNIARLYHADTLSGGTPWFAMEYVEGKHLDLFCKESQCSIETRLRLFRCVCEAVQYAHSLGIVHRDLKPSNILVKQDGTVKLLDFGIAKQLDDPDDSGTRTGLRFMTPPYAAPEQVAGEQVGTYTDIYSLGVILYELLSGRAIAGEAIEKPSVAAKDTGRLELASSSAWADLDMLSTKAMRSDPNDRYKSVEALIRDIDHYLKGEPLEARPDSLPYRAGKFVKRNRQAVVASSLALASLVGLISFFTLRLAQERDRANHETAVATATNRFLSDDLLGRTDPFKGANSKETFADVVKRASPQIDIQFKNEPEIAARLHGTLARAFENRTDFPQAQLEYDRAYDLLKQAEGPLSQNAILLRLQESAMLARSSQTLAKSYLAEAEASLARISQPRDDVAVWLLVTQGSIAIVENDAHSADNDFSTALHKAEASPSFDEVARSRILQLVAYSYIRKGDAARAEPICHDLVASLSKTLGPENPSTLRARVYLAEALYAQKKFADAIRETTSVYPALVRTLGEDHEITMTLLGTRAASEGSLGMWDAAIRDDLTVNRAASQKQGPASFFAVAMLSDAGLSQCLAGKYAEGEPNARKAFDMAKQAHGVRNGLTGGCAFALSMCLIGTNKLDEASDLLRNIDVKATAQQGGVPTVEASVALAQAEIAAKRGDYELAERDFKAAVPVLDHPDAAAADKQQLARVKTVLDSHLRASR